jgi:uncharacterized glyoxalase superfamily protein PhnB
MTTPATNRPEGTHQLSPHLVCAGAADAIDFYTRAFDAVELIRLAGPDGKLMHACIQINGSSVMLVDENVEYGLVSPTVLGGSPVTIHLVVDDAEAVAAQAVAAGATERMPVTEQFWGDRYGVIQDPFGHLWSIATPGAPMTEEQLATAMANVTA